MSAVPGTGTLLGVWAHPDDEAYLSAGLMFDHVAAGGRVVVLTATDGEHGTDDPVAWPPERLARHRRAELSAALAAVGVREHAVLGFGDGRCADVDGTELVALAIAELQPDVIVTFGPEGMTGHPDHRAVSGWVTEAWQRAGGRGELWYATLTDDFHERWGVLADEVGLWIDQSAPPSVPAAGLRQLVQLDGPRLDAKVAALRAHHSQTAALEGLVGADAFRAWWSTEAFVAAPRGSHPRHHRFAHALAAPRGAAASR
jgi:LmbE family N-acetylglucosaminyl deacetylase